MALGKKDFKHYKKYVCKKPDYNEFIAWRTSAKEELAERYSTTDTPTLKSIAHFVHAEYELKCINASNQWTVSATPCIIIIPSIMYTALARNFLSGAMLWGAFAIVLIMSIVLAIALQKWASFDSFCTKQYAKDIEDIINEILQERIELEKDCDQ